MPGHLKKTPHNSSHGAYLTPADSQYRQCGEQNEERLVTQQRIGRSHGRTVVSVAIALLLVVDTTRMLRPRKTTKQRGASPKKTERLKGEQNKRARFEHTPSNAQRIP